MDNGSIGEAWQKYLNGLFEKPLFDDLPQLFKHPHCATCKHWFLLDSDGIKAIARMGQFEYDKLIEGIQGKILKTYEVDGESDVYEDHLFLGSCKRYPPKIVPFLSRTRFGTFLEKITSHTHMLVPNFPVIAHEERCGEWAQDEWVERKKKHYKKNDME